MRLRRAARPGRRELGRALHVVRGPGRVVGLPLMRQPLVPSRLGGRRAHHRGDRPRVPGRRRAVQPCRPDGAAGRGRARDRRRDAGGRAGVRSGLQRRPHPRCARAPAAPVPRRRRGRGAPMVLGRSSRRTGRTRPHHRRELPAPRAGAAAMGRALVRRARPRRPGRGRAPPRPAWPPCSVRLRTSSRSRDRCRCPTSCSDPCPQAIGATPSAIAGWSESNASTLQTSDASCARSWRRARPGGARASSMCAWTLATCDVCLPRHHAPHLRARSADGVERGEAMPADTLVMTGTNADGECRADRRGHRERRRDRCRRDPSPRPRRRPRSVSRGPSRPSAVADAPPRPGRLRPPLCPLRTPLIRSRPVPLRGRSPSTRP